MRTTVRGGRIDKSDRATELRAERAPIAVLLGRGNTIDCLQFVGVREGGLRFDESCRKWTSD